MTEGKYSFEITKEAGWYIARDEERGLITQGRNEEEIFVMIADAYLTLNGIPVSQWDKFWHRFLKLN